MTKSGVTNDLFCRDSLLALTFLSMYHTYQAYNSAHKLKHSKGLFEERIERAGMKRSRQPDATSASNKRAARSLGDTLVPEALTANRHCQALVQAKLQTLAHQKHDNRLRAQQYVNWLQHHWRHLDDQTSFSKNIQPTPQMLRKKVHKWQRAFFSEPPSHPWSASASDGDDLPTEPDDNADTILRRNELEDATFLEYSEPTWTDPHLQTLKQILKAKQLTTPNKHKHFFPTIATELKKKNLLSPFTDQPLTPAECQLLYTYSQSSSQASASKKKKGTVSKADLKELQDYFEGDSVSDKRDFSKTSLATKKSMTEWQAFQAYRSSKDTVTSPSVGPWTIPEDTFLLKYLASKGPQFVLDIHHAAQLSETVPFIHNKPPKAIIHRVNATLLNPNYSRELWTKPEMQQVVVAMKVYDTTEQSSAINRTAAHLKNRSPAMVSLKWHRSILGGNGAAYFSQQQQREAQAKAAAAQAAKRKGKPKETAAAGATTNNTSKQTAAKAKRKTTQKKAAQAQAATKTSKRKGKPKEAATKTKPKAKQTQKKKNTKG